jgi:hypothetical protein
MQIINSKKEHLVDLKWPELLPKELPQSGVSQTTVDTKSGPGCGQVFQLTGWRGAGWRMVFLEYPAQ